MEKYPEKNREINKDDEVSVMSEENEALVIKSLKGVLARRKESSELPDEYYEMVEEQIKKYEAKQ